jgi:hypothetical protein
VPGGGSAVALAAALAVALAEALAEAVAPPAALSCTKRICRPSA